MMKNLANNTPIHSIFGVSSPSTGSLLMEAFEAYNSEIDPKKKEQNTRLYKLLLIINSFDLDLLSSFVKTQQKEKTLDIGKVAAELQMLQSFSGKDEKCALVGINWESDYTFANGYKAPPWRQVYGELCYLEVQCADSDRFIVTATKEGYFINKGYSADDKGKLSIARVCEMVDV
jgi:hypothetical protein